MSARAIALALLFAATGCPAPLAEDPAEWEVQLLGKHLVHTHAEDANRRDLMWLCADGTAVGRWNVPADDERGPTSSDDIARWSVRSEEGTACLAMAVDEDGLEIDSPCVVIVPDGDGFLLEDRRWVVAGDAGC